MFVSLLLSVAFASANRPTPGVVYLERPTGCNTMCVEVDNSSGVHYLAVYGDGLGPLGYVPTLAGDGSSTPLSAPWEEATVGIPTERGPMTVVPPGRIGWISMRQTSGHLWAAAFDGPAFGSLIPYLDESRAVPWLMYGAPGDFVFVGTYDGGNGRGEYYHTYKASRVVFPLWTLEEPK